MARKTLDQLRCGQKGCIVMIRGRGSFHRRLARMGLSIGHTVERGSASQAGGCLGVKADGIHVSVSVEDCGNIYLDVVGC